MRAVHRRRIPGKVCGVLSANRSFLESIRQAALNGLPIYAECGGSSCSPKRCAGKTERIRWPESFPSTWKASLHPGHGYSELHVDQPNPFFPTGLVLHGHEFHYSRISLGINRRILRALCFEAWDVSRNAILSSLRT